MAFSEFTSIENSYGCGEWKIISSHLPALIHCWFSLISGLEQKASMTFRRCTSFSINSSQLRASQGAPRRIKCSWKTPLSCRGKNRSLSICDVCNNPGEWVQLSGFDKGKSSLCSWIPPPWTSPMLKGSSVLRITNESIRSQKSHNKWVCAATPSSSFLPGAKDQVVQKLLSLLKPPKIPAGMKAEDSEQALCEHIEDSTRRKGNLRISSSARDSGSLAQV